MHLCIPRSNLRNNAKSLEINLRRETETGAVYIHSSRPGVSNTVGTQYERIIDEKYLDVSNSHAAYRLESFRSAGTVSSSLETTLRCYFIRKCDYVNPNPSKEEMGNIKLVGDKYFLGKATESTLSLYENIIKQVLVREGPVIEMYDVPNSREKRLLIGFKLSYFIDV